VFDGGVIWAFLAFTAVATLTAVMAFAPVRREPFSVFSFALGWIVAEVPVHAVVVVLAGTVVLGAGTPAHGWVWWLAGALGIVATVLFVVLSVVAHRSAGLVDEALDSATGGPIVAEGVDLAPAWLTWWRVVLAVPIRFSKIRRIRNIDYVGDGRYRHRCDIIVRRDDPPTAGPVLVYIHGGAWVIGDKREQGVPMMHELAARGWVCVAINYQLSPKATWPDHVVDCKRALAWVRAHIADYGGDPSFVALSGGSAGGHLSALVAVTPNDPVWQPGFEDVDTSVEACVPFYGVHDVTGDPEASGVHGQGMVRLLSRSVMKVTPDDDRAAFEQASPDRRVSASAPPLFVVQGANDTLVPVQVARRFVARARAVSKKARLAWLRLPRTPR